MKYTMSNDGIERANINIQIRLTREEFAALTEAAKEMYGHDLRTYCRNAILEDLAMRLPEEYDDYKKSEAWNKEMELA